MITKSTLTTIAALRDISPRRQTLNRSKETQHASNESNTPWSLTLILSLILWPVHPALSQAPYYQGKTLTILQSSDPGDTSDTMVRATIPVLRKHILGEPTIAYQYMPGGGGTKAANHIFHQHQG